MVPPFAFFNLLPYFQAILCISSYLQAPSSSNLAYSSGSSIAKASNARCEHGVIRNPSSVELQLIRMIFLPFSHFYVRNSGGLPSLFVFMLLLLY